MGRVPDMCREGRPEALTLALERSRLESARLDENFKVQPGHCVLPSWLAESLRAYLLSQWTKGMPGERGKPSIDTRLRRLFNHYFRYSVVEDLRDEGYSVLDARSLAEERTPPEYQAGSASDFERSHNIVSKEIRKNPDRYLMALLLGSVMLAT